MHDAVLATPAMGAAASMMSMDIKVSTVLMHRQKLFKSEDMPALPSRRNRRWSQIWHNEFIKQKLEVDLTDDC
jgi:hypothetical protein